MSENNIFETKVVEVPPETEDSFDGGYMDALTKIMDILESGDDGGDDNNNGDGGEQKLPDPRLIMPRKKNAKSKNNNKKSTPQNNKTMDIDTGEEEKPDDEEEQQTSNQEKADKAAEEAQQAADAAEKAANKAQESSDALQNDAEGSEGELSGSSDDVKQKKAEKAAKAAEKAAKAAAKAKKAAERAQKAAEKGDYKKAQEESNNAKDASNEAKMAANEMAHSSEVENMDAEQAAADAKKSAEEAAADAKAAREAADQMSSSGEDDNIKKTAQKAAERAEKAAKDAEKAAQQAQKAYKDGNLEKAQEAAQKGREAADIAKASRNSAERAEELNQESDHNEDWSGGDMSEEDRERNPEDLEGDLYDCSEYVAKVTKQFANKLTGPIGDFLNKCRDSVKDIKRIKSEQKKVAVKTYAKRAKNAWDVDFKRIIDTYVTDCIQERKRAYKHTYMKPNRRQGQVKDGDVIKKGRMPKPDKMDITMTFYIDISGSMSGGKVVNAFKAAYAYSDFIEKKNKSESIINSFDYTYYAFNTKFYKITGKKIPSANGDNVDFNRILEYIEEHSLNDMINVIITDAQFNIGTQKCIECIKRTSGLFIVIANNSRNEFEFEKMKKALQEKFEFLQADDNFTFKAPV